MLAGRPFNRKIPQKLREMHVFVLSRWHVQKVHTYYLLLHIHKNVLCCTGKGHFLLILRLVENEL